MLSFCDTLLMGMHLPLHALDTQLGECVAWMQMNVEGCHCIFEGWVYRQLKIQTCSYSSLLSTTFVLPVLVMQMTQHGTVLVHQSWIDFMATNDWYNKSSRTRNPGQTLQLGT